MKKQKKYALISVFNKNKIEKICNLLIKYKIEILATDSSAKHIKNLGFHCNNISKFTRHSEMLDGRVKTLHPLIHASLLFKRSSHKHKKEFNSLKFPKIEFLFVNLYPFEKYTKKFIDSDQSIEMIDIGGVSLLRSAAKNFNAVTVISSTDDYNKFISNMLINKGVTTLNFRKKMATKVFQQTSLYDLKIYNWFEKNKSNIINLDDFEKQDLNYGENPHQKAQFYKKNRKKSFNEYLILKNKKLSYNNILDIDASLNCISEFSDPTCVIIKHNNPCGVASHKNILQAFKKSVMSDPQSSFGGIVALNRKVDKKLASSMKNSFFEIIIAPLFSIESVKILSTKKKLNLLETKNFTVENKNEIKSVKGGYLLQEKNKIKFTKKDLYSANKYSASKKQLNDLIFAFKVCKHVKSNAIVLVKNMQTVGIGAGQMSRIDATKVAIMKKTIKNSNFVAASDAFFPFTDNIKLLLKHRCSAIIQPQGSINDSKVIKFTEIKKIPLYFSKYRFFKH